MGCKAGSNRFGSNTGCSDLIETLWDVKGNTGQLKNIIEVDLIETLWDVKEIKNVYDCKVRERFNRNIVGCKGENGAELSSLIGDLIETLWDVKLRDSLSTHA